MLPLRASVFHGEFAGDSGLCSSDRDSEYGGEIAQGKTWTALRSISTELASKADAQDDIDELDRTLEDQDERRWADERRTLNAENKVESELVNEDDHGENRMEASMNEEDSWTLTENTRTSMMTWSS